MATSIRLNPQTESRLKHLAAETGRTQAFYLREIIESGLQDAEDYYLSSLVVERVRNGTEQIFSAKQVRVNLGLDD